MKNLIKYTLHDYIRSHKYFPPISTFVILIFVFYTYRPNPIIDSYAVTSVMLYIISAWVCLSVLQLDPPVQRQLMAIHVGGWNRYYLAKLMTAVIIIIILSAYAFLYPIVFNMFGGRVTFTIGLVSFVNHIILAVLGISLASLFSKLIMRSTINSFGGLILTLVLSLAALGIERVFPSFLKNVLWVIPPATITQTPLVNWDGMYISGLSLFPFIWTIIYSLIIIFLFLQLAKRLR
ncbi:hypothetical protein [Oceanobacillus indicireducens]|uniref:Uncharacterized protein n=1 Tax=Oceanobacillus indicireducens TaxID=1004261 RepID=A0A918D4S4_9BACI|nr:hypothetical protein [Oceanobacillus indicireducens]GGN64920.1 hypothetical protein GCM10007971_33280 [Oceanobacillus indicireducens]